MVNGMLQPNIQKPDGRLRPDRKGNRLGEFLAGERSHRGNQRRYVLVIIGERSRRRLEIDGLPFERAVQNAAKEKHLAEGDVACQGEAGHAVLARLIVAVFRGHGGQQFARRCRFLLQLRQQKPEYL